MQESNRLNGSAKKVSILKDLLQNKSGLADSTVSEAFQA